MKRPLLLRLAPVRLREAMYYRLYRSRRDKWTALYTSASLHFAPDVRMQLCPTDEGHSPIAFCGYYEYELTERIVEDSKVGGLLVDVGANYGYFSLLWAAASKHNKVIAFEASPRNHHFLKDNIRRNSLEEQVIVREEALGRESGLASFYLGTAEQTGWGGLVTEGNSSGSVQVSVATLDASIPVGATIDVLKIDVEGADAWVLYGAENLLRAKRIRRIYFEHNKPRARALGIADSDARAYLSDLGYEVCAMGADDSDLVEYNAYPNF